MDGGRVTASRQGVAMDRGGVATDRGQVVEEGRSFPAAAAAADGHRKCGCSGGDVTLSRVSGRPVRLRWRSSMTLTRPRRSHG